MKDKIIGCGIIRVPYLFNYDGFVANGDFEFIAQIQQKELATKVFEILRKDNETKEEDITEYLSINKKGRVWQYKIFDIETRETFDKFMKLREEFRR